MKSRLRQHHHGNEIRVDAAYITLPGSDKTELGATATISRDGATVHTINAASGPREGIAGHRLKVDRDARDLIAIRLSKKGGNRSEWPIDLRIQEYPEVPPCE